MASATSKTASSSTSAACRISAQNAAARSRIATAQTYVHSSNGANDDMELAFAVVPQAYPLDANNSIHAAAKHANLSANAKVANVNVNVNASANGARGTSRSRKNAETSAECNVPRGGNPNCTTQRSNVKQRDGNSSGATSRDANANAKVRSSAAASSIDATSNGSSSSSGIGSASGGRATVDYDYFKKIYTEWVNHHLQKIANASPGIAPLSICDLEQDLRDGVVLARIIELIASQKLVKITSKPRNTVEMVGNLATCLDFIQNTLLIQMADITPASLFEGDLKSILRLLFALSQYKKQQIQQQKAAMSSNGAKAAHHQPAVSEANPKVTPVAVTSCNYRYPANGALASECSQPVPIAPKLDMQRNLIGLTPSRSSSSTISSYATGSISTGTTSTYSAASATSSYQSKTTSISSSNATSIHSDDSLLNDANNNSSHTPHHNAMALAHNSSVRALSAHVQRADSASATSGHQQAAPARGTAAQHGSSGTNSCANAANVDGSATRLGPDGQPHRRAVIVKPTVQSNTMPSSSTSKSAQPQSNNGTLNRRSLKTKHSQSVGPQSGNAHSLQISTSSRSSRSSSRSTSPTASSSNLRDVQSSTLNRHRTGKLNTPRTTGMNASKLPGKSGSNLNGSGNNQANAMNNSMTDSQNGSMNRPQQHPPTHMVRPSSKNRSTPASIAASKPIQSGGAAKVSRAQNSSIPVAGGNANKKSASMHAMQQDVNGAPLSNMQMQDLLRGEQTQTQAQNAQRSVNENDNIDPSKLVTFTPKTPRNLASLQRRSVSHYANLQTAATHVSPSSHDGAADEIATANAGDAQPSAHVVNAPLKPATTTSSTQCENSFLKREARRERHRSAERQVVTEANTQKLTGNAAQADKPAAQQPSVLVEPASAKAGVKLNANITCNNKESAAPKLTQTQTNVEGAFSYDAAAMNKVMVTSTDSIDDDETFLDFNNGALRSTKSPYSHLRVLSNGLATNAGANANGGASAAVTINGQTIPNLRLNLTRLYAERKRLNTIEEQEPRERVAAVAAADTDSCLSDAESTFQNGYTSDGDLLKPLGTTRHLQPQQSATSQLQSQFQSGYNSDYSGYVSEGGLSWYGMQRRSTAGTTANQDASQTNKYLKAGVNVNMNVTKLVQDLRSSDGSVTSGVRDLKNAFRELRTTAERIKKRESVELDSLDETSSWSSEDCLDSADKDRSNARLKARPGISLTQAQTLNAVVGWQSGSGVPKPGNNRLSLNLQKDASADQLDADCSQQLSVSSTAAECSPERSREPSLLSPGSVRPTRLSLPTFGNLACSAASTGSSVINNTSVNASQVSLNSMNGAALTSSASKIALDKDNAELHSSCSSGSATHMTAPQIHQDVEAKRLRKDLEHAYDKVAGLTRQLQANSQIVKSFEDTLKSMQGRICELTDSSDQKESELSQLRTLLTQLKEHQVALQTSVNPTVRVSTQPDLLTDAVSIQDVSLRDYLPAGSRLSMGSINSLASSSQADADNHLNRYDGKKHKKGWLMASFGKAFNKKKSNNADGMSVHSLQVDPYYVNVGSTSSGLNSSSTSGIAVSPSFLSQTHSELTVQTSDAQASVHSEQSIKPDDSISNAESVESDVEYLKTQLKEKEIRLTDAQLEALTTAHQLEQFKKMMVRMKVEMQTLKGENERLNGMLSHNMRKIGDTTDLLSAASFRNHAPVDQLAIPYVDLSASNVTCCLTVGVAMTRMGDCSSSHDTSLIGNIVIDSSTSWYELDAAVSTLFCGYTHLLDNVAICLPKLQKPVNPNAPRLGLCESSVRAYTFGSVQREPEESCTPGVTPYQASVESRLVRIQLNGFHSVSNASRRVANEYENECTEEADCALDQFAFETLIPKSVLERYLALLSEHKRLIFSGPPGTGKTFLAKRLAELLSLKMKRLHTDVTSCKVVESPTASSARSIASSPSANGQITCFVVDQKSHKELRQLLTHLTDKYMYGGTTPQTPTTPTDPQHPTTQPCATSSAALPQVLLLDNLHQLSQNMNEVLRNVAAVPQHASFYVLGTMHNAAALPNSANAANGHATANSANQHLTTCLEVHHEFRWIICGNHLEPTRSLLNRYLRRKLIDTELRYRMAQADSAQLAGLDERWRLLSAIQRWTVQLWFMLNRLLEANCCADLTVGPRIFFACPFDDPRNSQSWFTDLWNYSIFPYLLNAARDTSASRANNANSDARDASTIADDAFNWICENYPWPAPSDFSFLMRLRNNAQDDFNVDTAVNVHRSSDPKYEVHA